MSLTSPLTMAKKRHQPSPPSLVEGHVVGVAPEVREVAAVEVEQPGTQSVSCAIRKDTSRLTAPKPSVNLSEESPVPSLDGRFEVFNSVCPYDMLQHIDEERIQATASDQDQYLLGHLLEVCPPSDKTWLTNLILAQTQILATGAKVPTSIHDPEAVKFSSNILRAPSKILNILTEGYRPGILFMMFYFCCKLC